MTRVGRASSFSSARILSGVLSMALALPASAVAGASDTPGIACSQSSPSAVNQYCENIPSSTGGHQVAPGTPALATALPRATLRRLNAEPATRTDIARPDRPTRQALLRLPAPGAHHELPSGDLASASNWSVLWPVLAIVAAACVLGAVAAAHRRHTRRTAPKPSAAR